MELGKCTRGSANHPSEWQARLWGFNHWKQASSSPGATRDEKTGY